MIVHIYYIFVFIVVLGHLLVAGSDRRAVSLTEQLPADAPQAPKVVVNPPGWGHWQKAWTRLKVSI